MRAIETLEDDGDVCMPIKEHTVRKYEKLAYYLSLFTKSMRSKWATLVYMDLFSGPGRSKTDGMRHIYQGSPLIALNLEVGFDRYILCDSKAASIRALKNRVERCGKGKDVRFVEGDANENADKIIGLIPRASKTNKVLSFCFVDPYALSNLKFATIQKIGKLYVDMFVLIPSFMDAKRNQARYLNSDNTTVEEFLGDKAWRDKWSAESEGGRKFGAFLMNAFGEQMKGLGYLYDPEDAETVFENGTRRALYHLCLFSKHEKGRKFWKEAMKYTDEQTELNL